MALTGRLLCLCAVAAGCLLYPTAFAETHSHDTVLIHGRIFTGDARRPWAEALRIRDGKILNVGSDQQIARYRTRATKVIDARGRLVLPGFTDCHVHLFDGAIAIEQLSLDDATTVKEIQQRLRAYSAAHPGDPWLLGRGWTYPVFAPSGLPDKKYLDEVVPNRPVYLESFDGHSWWANSKALQAARITKDTPDPPGGTIVRDPATAEPTGAVKEDAADALIRQAIPEPSRQAQLNALRAAIRQANRFGLTRVHIVGGISAGHNDLQKIDLYEELRRKDELTLRLYIAYRLDPPELTGAQLKEIINSRNQFHDDWIAAGAAKFFLDGVIETHTAAMLAPYSNDPSASGQLLWDPEKYRHAVTELDRRGIQVFTHAIGDRAIRLALDAYQEAARSNHTKDARHRIEHVEDPAQEDVPRFGQLGVIASMQPLHAYPDDDALKSWAPAVGSERAERAWAWRSIQSRGGVLAFGSDWPIVTISPWPGVQNAVTRQTTEGKPEGGWIPSERISLADAIKSYTLNAAFAGHRERSEGSLEPGKLADAIILSDDVFKADPHQIGRARVLLTMVGGRVVYTAEDF